MVKTDCTRTFTTNSPEETRSLGVRLGMACRGGEAFLLFGDLGSGKTCFVQGLAEGLEIPGSMRVTSPTFTLHAEYPGRLVLNHLDLYRLDDPISVDNLGVGDMFADRTAVTAVEWPEMLADAAGRERLEIHLGHLGEGRRTLAFTPHGRFHRELVAGL